MEIIKRNSNRLNRIYVDEYQLSIHLEYYVGVWIFGAGGWMGGGVASKRYLSELEYILNQIKRK